MAVIDSPVTIPLTSRRPIRRCGKLAEATGRTMRQAYLVEEFRFHSEADGQIVERPVREPEVHLVNSQIILIERTKTLFEFQVANAPRRSALSFDGIKIIRDRDRKVVFKLTVREYWDALEKLSSEKSGVRKK